MASLLVDIGRISVTVCPVQTEGQSTCSFSLCGGRGLSDSDLTDCFACSIYRSLAGLPKIAPIGVGASAPIDSVAAAFSAACESVLVCISWLSRRGYEWTTSDSGRRSHVSSAGSGRLCALCGSRMLALISLKLHPLLVRLVPYGRRPPGLSLILAELVAAVTSICDAGRPMCDPAQ